MEKSMRSNGKRLGAMLLALVMVFSLLPTAAFAVRLDDEIAIDAPDIAVDATPAGTLDAGADDGSAQLMAGDTPEYTTENIMSGLFDVGATVSGNAADGWTASYSNPLAETGAVNNDTVIRAWASSQHASGNDGAAWKAVDGIVDTTGDNKWHTRWSGSDDAANNNPDELGQCGYGEAKLAESKENRWIELDIMSNGQVGDSIWLNGLRYHGHNGNGRVTECEIRVSTDGTTWTTVTSTTNWTVDNGAAQWNYKAFDEPVQANRVRLYGVTTTNNNKNMQAKEIRLVKTETQNPTSRDFSVTVKDAAGNAITGATVTCASKTATESNGTYTIAGLYDGDYTVTVAKDGYKTRTLPITVSESSTTAETTLCPPLSPDNLTKVQNHLYDYPIWANADQSDENHAVNGGAANAYSWAHGSGDNPWWAAIDGIGSDIGTMWHANYGSHGQAAASDNVGMWFEFTLGQKTNIIGVWVYTRDHSNSNLTSVAVRVNGTDNTLTSKQWAALPAEVATTSFTNNSWQFIELPEPVEAKQVRIYANRFVNPGDNYFVAKELRVVMDPETSGAKHVAGTVKSSAAGNDAIAGATVTVANHSATSAETSGAFDLGYLPAGTYSVTASAPGYAPVTETVTISADTDPAALELQLTPQTRSLTVTVKGTGDAVLENATVTLQSNDANALPVANVPSATTTAQGVATLDVTYVVAGTYKLRVTHPDYDVNVSNTSIPSTGDATAEVTLTARAKADHDLVKTYDFSDAAQVQDFTTIAQSGAATIEHDADKGAMKITFVDDNTSYKNLVINKKYMMEKGWLEFDVTPAGTVGANAAIGAAVRFSGTNDAWLHVGQLGTVLNSYAASVHTSATAFTDWSGNVTTDYVAMGNGATRRFGLQVKDATQTEPKYRTELTVDGTLGGWKADHTGNYAITNDVGLWGFDAKNANGLVVYIDNVKLYRPTADKRAVTIGALGDGNGTLTTKIVTELDTEGTALTTGGNAYAGDTIQISASGVPNGKVFAVKVTKTGDANTVVTTTKVNDTTYTFTMPAYPVTITPAAATQLTANDVTVTGVYDGSGVDFTLPNGQEFPVNYVRQGKELTAAPAAGVTYQWQKKVDNGEWENISGATSKTYTPTSLYNADNVTLIRVQVTGDNMTYTGVVTGTEYTLLNAVTEVSEVTFERSTINMWVNLDTDPNANDTAEEPKTTVVKASISPTTASRPMTVTWESDNPDVVSISNAATHADLEGEGSNARLVVTATLTANKVGTAHISCTVQAKDGSVEMPCTTGIDVTVKAKTESVKVYMADGQTGTAASATEVTVDNPLVLYTNNATDLETIGGNKYNSYRLFATPNPAEVSDVETWQWVRQDQSLTGLIRAENTNGNNATRLVYAQGSAQDGYTEQNVGERTILVKKTGTDTVYCTFRVVVLRHLIHNVTVGYTGGATEARPGVTVEAVASALNIGDAGVRGLTYEWYRKAAGSSTAVKIADQSGKTYTLTDADIGCEISVKVIATPKYGTDVPAEQRYYYEGERTSTNSITVLKNAAPAAPELTSTPYDGTNADNPIKGTIVITSPVSGETYEYRKKTSSPGKAETWNDWTDAELTGAGSNTIADLDAGDYQVRIKENNLHDAGTAKAVTVQDSSKTYYNVEVTVTTQDYQGSESNTLTGGTAVRGSEKVEAGQPATLTVTPNEGFEILSVMNGETALTDPEDGENGAKTYTVSNVTAPVAFAVTFKQKSVTITHNFTNLKCNLAGLSNNSHTVAYGSVTEITVSLADEVNPNAYELPERGGITMTMGGASFTNFTYIQDTGKITITGGVTDNVTITASAKAKSYTVSFTNMSNVSGPSGTQNATYGTDYEAQLTASSGYSLPETVTVKRGETTLTQGTDYTYANGKVTVKGAAITGNITISATGVKNTTPLTAVELTISHTDENVSDKSVPHVGDTIRANPKAGAATATASYVWYVGGVEITDVAAPDHQSYTVRAGDVGKVIKVVATGTVDYSGTAEASTPAVAEKTYAVTGITLNKSTTSIVFGGEETLSVTFTPSNATNKNVTWSTSDAAIATVDATGKVTAKKVGVATITATTVDGSIPASCRVTVTAKDLTNVDTATVRVSGALELGETVTATLVPADAATGASYVWSIVNTNGDTVYTFTENGQSVTLPNDSSYLGAKVKVVVTYRGNYSGTKTRITDGVIAGEVPSHSVVIATGIQNGSVTADKATAKEGEIVTLTIAPATGYELDTLTVTGYHDEVVTTAKVDDTHYTFIMPRNLETGGVVNVTATFVTESEPDPETPDTTALEAAITAAEALKDAANVIDKDETDVVAGTKYHKQAAVDALDTAIENAKAAKDAATTADDVTAAVNALNTAVETFKAAELTGTLDLQPLKDTIKAARDLKATVFVIDDKNVDEVADGVKFVTTADMETLNNAIKAAEDVLADPADAAAVTSAVAELATAKATFDAAIKTGEATEGGYVPTVDTTALEAAITAAEAAKKGVTVSDKTPAEVNRGTKFVTQEVMDALDAAIEAAKTAKDAENKTHGSVSNAMDALNAAAEEFKAAIQTGTKSTGGNSSGSRPSTGTTTETKPDGTKVTTETKPDGTKVVTTESPDGSKEVVETKKDGTVTETKTDAEGAKTEKVTTPDKDVTITVTDKDGEELAKIELPAEIPASETKFEDVPADHWAEEAIHKMAGLELVNGTGDNKYSPMSPMTRGALVTVLHRLSQGKTNYETTFEDVANGQYYAEGVAWAAKTGVVKGITDELFAPDQSITREQLAVMMTRYAKLIGLDTAADASTLDSFTDADQTGDWAVDGTAWCVKVGILQGKGNSILDPSASVSRAEVAMMLDRFLAIVAK